MFDHLICWCKGIDPARFFLFTGLVFATLYACVNPPLQGEDEYTHFERAYATAKGEWIPLRNPGPRTEGWFIGISSPEKRAQVMGAGTYLPESFIRSYKVVEHLLNDERARISFGTLWHELGQPMHSTRSGFVTTYLGNYSALTYLPHTALIWALKHFNISPFWLVYSGRLGGILAWCLLVYYAIGLMPFGKWVMAYVALAPMAVYLSGSLSADPMTSAFFFLFSALLMRHFNSERIPRRALFAAMLLCLLIAMCKGGSYGLFLGLLMLWTPRQLGGRKRYAAFMICSLGLALLVFSLWNWQTKNMYYAREGAYPEHQIEFIKQQPLKFAKLLAYSMVKQSAGLVSRQLGGFTRVQSVTMSRSMGILYFLGLILICLSESDEPAEDYVRVKNWRRGYFLCVLLSFTVILYVVEFVAWNLESMREVIQGVQGRYFIPILPLGLIMLFSSLSRRVKSIPQTACWLKGVRLTSLFILYITPTWANAHNPMI